jgi:hypothetical protein
MKHDAHSRFLSGLAGRCLAGDQDAWASLYFATRRSLACVIRHGLARYGIRNPDQAEDILQLLWSRLPDGGKEGQLRRLMEGPVPLLRALQRYAFHVTDTWVRSERARRRLEAAVACREQKLDPSGEEAVLLEELLDRLSPVLREFCLRQLGRDSEAGGESLPGTDRQRNRRLVRRVEDYLTD